MRQLNWHVEAPIGHPDPGWGPNNCIAPPCQGGLQNDLVVLRIVHLYPSNPCWLGTKINQLDINCLDKRVLHNLVCRVNFARSVLFCRRIYCLKLSLSLTEISFCHPYHVALEGVALEGINKARVERSSCKTLVKKSTVQIPAPIAAASALWQTVLSQS